MEPVADRYIFTFKRIGPDHADCQFFGRPCQVQTAEAFLCGDDRPVFGYAHIRIMGVVRNIFVMALHPCDQIFRIVCFQYRTQDLGRIFGGKDIFQLGGKSVIRDPHMIGIDTQVPPGRRIQDLSVGIEVFAGLFLIISFCHFQGVVPEITRIIGILLRLDMLGCIEAESVDADIDAFLKECKDPFLHIGIGSIQIRKCTVRVILRFRTGSAGVFIVMEGDAVAIRIFIPICVDDRFILCYGGRNGRSSVCLRFNAVRVGQMVHHDIRQYTDAVFLCFRAELGQLFLGAQRRIITDQKTERLIESPPVGSSAFRLLHRHGQHIFEASVLDVLQIDQDLMISPVKCVKCQSVFCIFGKRICIAVFKIIAGRNLVAAAK